MAEQVTSKRQRQFRDAANNVRCRADITLKDGSKAQCGRKEDIPGGGYCWQHIGGKRG